MKKATLLLLSLLSIYTLSYAQSWQWGKRAGNDANGSGTIVTDEDLKDITVDNAGNVYFIATVQGQGGAISIDGRPGTFTGYGGRDILVCSYTCNGNFRWKKTIGGAVNDGNSHLSIGTDTLGNVFFSGFVSQSPSTPAKFDADTTLSTANPKGFFVARYDTSGNFKWLRMPAPDTISYITKSRYPIFDMWVNKDGTVDLLTFIQQGGPIGNSNTFYADSSRAYILSYSLTGNITRFIKPHLTMR